MKGKVVSAGTIAVILLTVFPNHAAVRLNAETQGKAGGVRTDRMRPWDLAGLSDGFDCTSQPVRFVALPPPTRFASLSQLAAAPRFKLPAVDGSTLSAAQLANNVVVLDFWATWCGPCIDEISDFNRLQAVYRSRGVKVIGVAVQSGWLRDIKKFVARHELRYTILAGNDDTVTDFDVINFPTTYLIAPGWKIYKKYSGSYNGKAAEIEHDLEVLLKPQ